MLLSEAYEKVTKELSEEAKQSMNDALGGDEAALSVVAVIDSVSEDVLAKYTFGGALKEFVNLRAKKTASSMVAGDIDFSSPDEAFEKITHDLFGQWRKDLVTMFAMGYTFSAPENADVPRDKDGFVAISRKVDRDLITIQVGQFSNDLLLMEKMEERLNSSAEFITGLFTALNVQPTKYGIRDWLTRVLSICSFDGFVAGSKVRDLLEQEAAFESMMKEMDE